MSDLASRQLRGISGKAYEHPRTAQRPRPRQIFEETDESLGKVTDRMADWVARIRL